MDELDGEHKRRLLDFQKSVEDFKELHNSWIGELSWLAKTKKLKCLESPEDLNAYKAIFLRTLFSAIEAEFNTLKKVIENFVDIVREDPNIFSFHLGEEQRFKALMHKEKIEIKVNIQETIYFLFRMLKTFGYERQNLEFNNRSTKWQSLCAAIDRRDSVTHPKQPKDLNISDDFYKKQIYATYSWFVDFSNSTRDNLQNWAERVIESE